MNVALEYCRNPSGLSDCNLRRHGSAVAPWEETFLKFVGDTLSFSRVSDDGRGHAVYLPIFHRAAVGVLRDTRLFAVPLDATNEIVLTPIDPARWDDLWRLDATVSDEPGSAKTLVETLVDHQVNVLVHEGVSESAPKAGTVHQIFEILDLTEYGNDFDGIRNQRNTVHTPLYKPNYLINRLIANSARCLSQTTGNDAWEMRFERMEFFFRHKDHRTRGIPLRLDDQHEVHLPGAMLKRMEYGKNTTLPLPLHIISDTEQKYVKLRVLAPHHYYLLLQIEHDERVGAIDEFMRVLRSHNANMIDSYSRLKDIARTALFYALAEFSTTMDAAAVLSVVNDLKASPMARDVVLRGAAGDGPELSSLVLPAGVSYRPGSGRRTAPRGAADAAAAPEAVVDARRAQRPFSSPLGTPYFLDRHNCRRWRLNAEEVFMAIPFAREYGDFYEANIASLVRDAGLQPVRVDESPGTSGSPLAVAQIEERIARCRFVIADLSRWSASVVYEIGLAVGISKPLLLLCEARYLRRGKHVPFDLNQFQMLAYDLYEVRELQRRLKERILDLKERTRPSRRRR